MCCVCCGVGRPLFFGRDAARIRYEIFSVYHATTCVYTHSARTLHLACTFAFVPLHCVVVFSSPACCVQQATLTLFFCCCASAPKAREFNVRTIYTESSASRGHDVKHDDTAARETDVACAETNRTRQEMRTDCRYAARVVSCRVVVASHRRVLKVVCGCGASAQAFVRVVRARFVAHCVTLDGGATKNDAARL